MILEPDPAARAIADDPTTSPERLHALATYDEDVSVRAAVARNPNASLATLEKLAWKLCSDVERNPSLPFYLLENGYETSLWEHFARHSTDPDKLRACAAHPRLTVRRTVVTNPFLPADAVEHLLIDSDHAVANDAIRHPNLPMSALERVWIEGDLHDLSEALRNPKTPADILLQFHTHTNFGIRLSVASNPSTPGEALATLAHDTLDAIREAVASNPSTPADVLLILVPPPGAHAFILRSLTSNPALPAPIVRQLAMEMNHNLFYPQFVHHPNVPLDTLEELTKSHSLSVRREAAKLPYVSDAALERFLSEEDEQVREAAAATRALRDRVLSHHR